MHPHFDAVLLAGGRASRLGGGDKTALVRGHASLLDLAVEAAEGARRLVVVGLREGTAPPTGAVLAQEKPPFSGPVAAIAAGLAALPGPLSALTLVLACDVPRAPAAVEALWAGLPGGRLTGGTEPDVDGFVAVDDDGRRQPLLAVYLSSALVERLDSLARERPLDGLSMRRLLDPFHLVGVAVGSDLCADVDSPDDLARLGVEWPRARSTD